MSSSIPDRTRQALERAAAAAERRKPPAPKPAPEEEKAPVQVVVEDLPKESDESLVDVAKKSDEEKQEEDAVDLSLGFSVGEEVFAQWRDDGLFYRARVERAGRVDDGRVWCDVTFVEYGNSQEETFVVLSKDAFDEMQRACAKEESGSEEEEPAAVVAPPKEEEKKEIWSLEDRPATASLSTVAVLQRSELYLSFVFVVFRSFVLICPKATRSEECESGWQECRRDPNLHERERSSGAQTEKETRQDRAKKANQSNWSYVYFKMKTNNTHNHTRRR
jgi:hypothetical protein